MTHIHTTTCCRTQHEQTLYGYTKDNGIMNYCADCEVPMGTEANVPVRCRPCIAQRNAVALALVPPNTGTVYGEAPAHA